MFLPLNTSAQASSVTRNCWQRQLAQYQLFQRDIMGTVRTIPRAQASRILQLLLNEQDDKEHEGK